MCELGVDRLGERVAQSRNFFRNRAQSIQMLSELAPAGFIGDNLPALPKRVDEIFLR